VNESVARKAEVKELFAELFSSEQHQPVLGLSDRSTVEHILDALKEAVVAWAKKEGSDDPRYIFPA
jgi:hypothetical protein